MHTIKRLSCSLLCLISLGTFMPGRLFSQSSPLSFSTTDTTLQKLYDRAEELARENIVDYGGRKVLIEGAQYRSVWLETQPMGGYMYAKRNPEVARNNLEIFMDYQRPDGRLPGVIYNRDGIPEANYCQFQGLYFPMPAFELYYLLGKDTAFLQRVYRSLEAFDAYLWKTRDSDQNGCLETWCIFDNGEDHSVRYNGFPKAWAFDTPPSKEAAAQLSEEELRLYCKETRYDSTLEMTVPIESMDVMSYSYSCREVLARISRELDKGQEKFWADRAMEVAQTLEKYLWDPEKAACFDRDRNNETMPILLHNNLRCMYFGSFSQEMADAFISRHLMNTGEFWTPMPLPSIAASDPAFENVPGNNWSGQPQGLTYQRSIRALENYGHYAELSLLGRHFLDVLSDSLRFTQQFDPFTATINPTRDGYGPTILASLEFISRLYGIHISQDRISWSCLGDGFDYKYTQEWNGKVFRQETRDGMVHCFINGLPVMSFTRGIRVVTGLSGEILEIVGISQLPLQVKIRKRKSSYLVIGPNTVFRPAGKKRGWEENSSVKFYPPFNPLPGAVAAPPSVSFSPESKQ
ncbi:MAG: MGH1-like glycoside hydrolase domain-containing protein [Bacteroidota bacterium]